MSRSVARRARRTQGIQMGVYWVEPLTPTPWWRYQHRQAWLAEFGNKRQRR